AELVVDLDVRVPLAQRDLLAEDRELQRSRVEVEKLREHLDVRALVGEEDRHDGRDDRHGQAVAEQEAEVGGDPALGDHEVLVGDTARAPSCVRWEPSTRKTSPSEPTARPRPPDASQTERIQLAASCSGSGSTVHVAPPSVVFRTVPWSPTIQPCCPRTKTSNSERPCTGGVTGDHVAPPSAVRRITESSPTAMPCCASLNRTPKSVLSTGVVCCRQVCPASVLASTTPNSPTCQTWSGSPKLRP